MSLQSAIAILDKANAENPLESKPGVNPNDAKLIENKQEIYTKESLNNEPAKESIPKPEEPKKEELKKEPETEKKDEAPKENEQDSKRFALLAKKEKALYQRNLELKSREESINNGLKAIENFEKYKYEVKNNPMLALKELGITYDDITQYVLKGEMPNKHDLSYNELKQELESLRNELKEERETKKKEELTNAQQRAQDTIDNFKQEIVEYIDTNQDKYELIKIHGLQNHVYNRIEEVYTKEKRILPLQDACDWVEQYILEQFNKTKEAKKLRATKEEPKEEKKQSLEERPRTLNNQMTSSAPSFLPAATEKERMARAMAKLSTP